VRRTLFDLTTMSVELEAILGRKVDLLTRRSVEDSPNYIRRKSTAQVIYAE
jgi:predicted nucleotidyltransferase